MIFLIKLADYYNLKIIFPRDGAVVWAEFNIHADDIGNERMCLAVLVENIHVVQKRSVNWGEPVCSTSCAWGGIPSRKKGSKENGV